MGSTASYSYSLLQEEDSGVDVDSNAASVCSTTSSSSAREPPLKVFIKQFPPSVTRRDIKDHLSVCGVSDHVKSIRIFYDKTKKKSKGCGYVEYAPASAGRTAMVKLNGSLLLGTHKLQAKEFVDKRSDVAPSKSGRKQRDGKGKKASPLSPTPEMLFPVSCYTPFSLSPEEEVGVKDPVSASGETWKVFVGSLNSKQLPSSVQTNHLQQHFEDFMPSIVRAYIVLDKKTKQSKGYGFVQFRSKEAAQEAIDKLNGSQLHGCILKLEFARKKVLSNCESDTDLPKSPKYSAPTTTALLPSPKKGQAQLQQQVGYPPTNSAYSATNATTVLVGLPLVAQGEQSPRQKYFAPTETCRVFVGGAGKSRLPETVQDCHLHHHFQEFDPAVVNAYIERHKETKQSKGYGFIQFTSPEVAQRAIAKMNGSILEGCRIKVQYDKSEQNTSTSGAQVNPYVPQSSPKTLLPYFPPPLPHSQPQSMVSPSNGIAVSNLSPAISKEEISSLCGGTITFINIEPTGPSSNKAEIRFSSLEEAQDAITRLNGKEFLGNILSVAFIQPSQPQHQPQVQSQVHGNELMFPVKVTHISPTTSEAMLVQQFKNAGEIVDYKFPSSGNRYALINFKQEYEAHRAVEMFNGRTIDRWKINVSQTPAITRKSQSLPYSQPGYVPQPVTIEVSNLNPQLQVHEHWKGLTEVFNKYQSAKVVDVIPPHAYVRFSDANEAQAAITHLDCTVLGGSAVWVQIQPSQQLPEQGVHTE